jgi:tetratricopeptide (TPR) repeat protein
VEVALRGSATAQREEAYVLSGKAHSLCHLKRWREALEVSEQALALELSRVDVWTFKGVALHRLKRLDEAVGAERTVVTLYPSDAEGWSSLALTLMRLGQFQEALTACEQGIAHATLARNASKRNAPPYWSCSWPKAHVPLMRRSSRQMSSLCLGHGIAPALSCACSASARQPSERVTRVCAVAALFPA